MAEGLGLPIPGDYLQPGGSGFGGDADVTLPELVGYELLRPLGSGGMGRVFLARQKSLDRLVAVKLLSAAGGIASQLLDRLEREAHSMARMSHPNIVPIYDFVRLEDGGAAIVMEWVEYGNLRERWLSGGGPMCAPREAVALARQIAEGLGAAHAAGIVHRDLKPENVLVSQDGSLKVGDFGLALPLDKDSLRLTLSGTSIGTLGYIAPEQLDGSDVDERADLYSLGVILYELLVGRKPQGNFDPPRALRRDVGPRLEKVVLKALRNRPEDRFATAEEFAASLGDAMGPARAPIVGIVGLGTLLAGAALLVARPKPPRGSGSSSRPFSDPSMASSTQAPAGPGGAAARARAPAPPGLHFSAPPLGFSIPADWLPALSVRSLRGEWAIDPEGGYRSDEGISLLQILSDLPPEGADVRVAFTRLAGRHSIAVFFRREGGVASAGVASWELDLAGIQNIEGKDLRHVGNPSVHPIENGRRYEMFVEIRRDRVRLFVDGKLLDEATIEGRYLNVSFPWNWESLDAATTALAIGSYQSPTWFHEVEVVEAD